MAVVAPDSSPRAQALLKYICLPALVGLFVVPFVLPWHFLPLSAFYNEWLALALGTACLAVLGGRPLVLPRIALLPLGLAALICVQGLWMPAGMTPRATLAVFYLVWAGLLATAAPVFAQELGEERLAAALAKALLLAALLNTVCVLLYYAGVRGSGILSLLAPDPRAHLGQQNHLADLLAMGVASALYLWLSSRRRIWLAMALPLLLAAAWTGARAPIAYAIWLVAAAWGYGDRRLLRISVGLAAVYALALLWGHFLPVSAGTDTLSRVAVDAQAGSGQVRQRLLAAAAAIASDHPWIGAGWGAFAWESYQRAVTEMETGEHAHQLLFQLAAEMGIPAALGAAAALLFWGVGAWSRRQTPARWWALCVAGVMLLHAQVEYPLWYAYFLGPCAFVMGLAEARVWPLPRLRLSGLTTTAAMIAAGWLLASTLVDNIRLERWLQADARRQGQAAGAGHYQLLADLHRDSLLREQAGLMLAAVMPPTRDMLSAKRDICNHALAAEPQQPAVFTCALLDDMAGETALAERRWRQAVTMFPNDVAPYREKLRRLDGVDEVPLQRLLNLAPLAVKPAVD